MLLVLAAAPPSSLADDSGLFAGGLTTAPLPARLGTNLVADSSFELALTTTPWGMDRAWSKDLLVRRSGYSSLRLSGANLVQYSQKATQTLRLRKGVYRLSGWIRTDRLGANASGSGVRLSLRSNDGGGTTRTVSGTTEWTFFEERHIVIGSDQTASVWLEAYREPSGSAWFDDVRVEPELPHPLAVFMLYPNFRGMLFDDQPQTLRFDVTVTPPLSDFTRYRIVATLREETSAFVVTTATFTAAPRVTVALSAFGLRYGVPYLAALKLVDRVTGATVYAPPAHRVSRVHAATRDAMNVSVDDANRILVRGQPRFVLGVYDSGLAAGTSDTFWEQTLWSSTGARRMGNLRINFYLNYYFGDMAGTSLQSLVTNLARRGVTYVQTANCFDRSRQAFAVDRSDAYVDLFANVGGGGYYTADECHPTMVPGTFTQYQRLRRLHPDSITVGTLLARNALYLWRDAVDVLATDPYPLYGTEPTSGYPHHIVADWTERARNAVLDARPIMTVLQFFKFTSTSRWPSRGDLRNHAYMAIVEGAKGLWWWSLGSRGLASVCDGWCTTKVQHMSNLTAVVGEIASLESVLLADDRSDLLTYNSNPSAVRTLVKHFAGRTYVFAYNYTGTSTRVTLAPRGASGRVSVYAEGRTLTVSSGLITDVFGPYQAHVYVTEPWS